MRHTKEALVTGCGSGPGLAITIRFTEAGINMKSRIIICILSVVMALSGHTQLIAPGKTDFTFQHAVILTDTADFALIQRSAELLQQDIEKATGFRPLIIHDIDKPYANIIVIGTITRSALLKELVAKKKLSFGSLASQWEAYQVKNIINPFPHIKNILTLAGSDRRGLHMPSLNAVNNWVFLPGIGGPTYRLFRKRSLH